jgi:hypothetical protein
LGVLSLGNFSRDTLRKTSAFLQAIAPKRDEPSVEQNSLKFSQFTNAQ